MSNETNKKDIARRRALDGIYARINEILLEHEKFELTEEDYDHWDWVIKEIAGIVVQEILQHVSGARWLKLKPAAKYASMGTQKLKQLAKDGEIIGYPDPDSKRGDWIFDKRSIDSYRETQNIELQERILEVERRTGM